LSAYKIIVLEEAITDIAEAMSFYNARKPSLGFEFEKEVFLLFEIIASNPELFPVKFASVHEALVARFPFVVNYEVLGKKILVSAVFHVKQNPSKKVKRQGK
jgi:plasmid stabilization system protein ParE